MFKSSSQVIDIIRIDQHILNQLHKDNYTIERIWPEVNSRINYPINNIFVDLEEREVFDLTDEAVKYCVSQNTCNVASVGMEGLVQSWNSHKIQGNYHSVHTYIHNLYLYTIYLKQYSLWGRVLKIN